MWPIKGFWCDGDYFTDPVLLEEISGRSGDAATGVLTNRNLKGEAYLRTVSKATLTAAAVEKARPAALTFQRSPEEQVALVKAALARSSRAGEMLLEHVSPAAAWRLWGAFLTERFRGATTVRDTLLLSVPGQRMRAQSADPDYRRLIGSLIEFVQHEPGYWVTEPLVCACATAADTEDDLNAVCALFADAAGLYSDAGVHELLLATRSYPQVVRHWAGHGGDVGKIVAAADHRQDPQFLDSLAGTTPAANEAILFRLARNPATDTDTVIDRLAETVGHVLRRPTANERLAQLNRWTYRARAAAQRDGAPLRTPIGDIRDAGELTTLAGPDVDASGLLAVELLLNPHTPRDIRSRLVGNIVSLSLSQDLWAELMQADMTPIVQSHRVRHLAALVNGYHPDRDQVIRTDTEAMRQTLASLHTATTDYVGRVRNPLAPWLAAKLTRAEQIEKLLGHTESTLRVGSLYAAVQDVLEQTPAMPATAGPSFASVFGDALGSID